MRIYFSKLHKDAQIPQYKTAGAAGMDLTSVQATCLYPNERKVISTGLAMEMPMGYEAQVRPRSGLAANEGVTVLNTPGTIDSDYRGEIKIILINLGQAPFWVNVGDRIAQLVIAPVTQAEVEVTQDLSQTERGEGGLGSTGR